MKKAIYIFTPIFLCLVLVISAFSSTVEMSEDISSKVFRLHILANSNEDYDQELKLKVRDEVLLLSEEIFSSCKTAREAVDSARNSIDLITEKAKETIILNGYNYDVKAYVTKEYFKTRKYNNFSLPAGIYDSLKIEIGKGSGKNWWCVMFPSVCLSGCTDDFKKSLTDEEIRMIEEDEFIVKFKVIEILESIKNRIQ